MVIGILTVLGNAAGTRIGELSVNSFLSGGCMPPLNECSLMGKSIARNGELVKRVF
jgi:hypothetical protein